MEQNDIYKVEDSKLPESYIEEEALTKLAKKPIPKLQSYIEKYNNINYDTAKKLGVHGVKTMLDDYQSGVLHQNLPNLMDSEVIASIEQLENNIPTEDDSLLSKTLDVPVQVVGGFRDAAQAVMDLGSSIGEWGATKYIGSENINKVAVEDAKKNDRLKLPDVQGPKSIAGSLVRGVTQFLAPFGALNKVGKAAGVVGKATSTAGKYAEASAVGAATDFLAFGEHEKRLSDLIESNPSLSNPVSRYLKSNINDSAAEGRFKNALEGLGLGATVEGMFRAVKWIKNTNVVNSTINDLRKASESRTSLINKSYDDLLSEIKMIPLRDKKPTSLEQLSKSADNANVNWTKEDLLSGKVVEELDAKSLQPLAIKATQIQEQAFNQIKEAIPEYRARIEAGDSKAIDNYWNEMVDLHKLDFIAKDIASKHGGAEAMVYRRHNSAVEQANSMYKIFANADTLDKRQMVEAHMNILEAKGDVDGFIDGLTMSKGDKLKRVLKSVYMANILSSPVTHFKNVVSTSLNSLVYAPLEHTVGAAVGSIRRKIGAELEARAGQKIANGFFSNIEDGIQWKESQILFHSQISSISDGINYIGRALKGQTESAISAAKSGEKLSKLKDITDAATGNRFDKGVSYDNISNSGFDALSLGIEKEGVVNTAFYHLANFIGNLTKKPGSLIQTYDDAMKGMYFKAKVEAQSYRLAVKEGLEGEALNKRWKELYQMATFKPDVDSDILNGFAKEKSLFSNDEVIKNIQEDAMNFASEYTYTKKLGSVGNSFQNLRDNIDKIMPIIPGGSIIMPFMKTPINLMKFFMMDRGPLAPLTQSWRADFAAGGARADMAMSRLGTGTSMFGLGYYLASNGYIFGDGPKNFSEKALQRDMGFQERSVRIGDKFIDIGWVGPLADFLLYPANIVEFCDHLDDDLSEDQRSFAETYIGNGILRFASLLNSKSFMMGLSEITSAITDQDEKNFTRVLKNYASAMAVPNIASYIGKVINPAMQDADGLWETIGVKAGINIRQRRDIFGREINRNPMINNYMVPISYSTWKEDHTIASIIDAGAYIQKPKRVVDGVRLSYDQYDKMMGFMKEQDVYGQIEKFVKSPIFTNAPSTRKSIDDEGDSEAVRKGMIQKIYNENLGIARQRLVSETPELQNKIFDFKVKTFTKPAISASSSRLFRNLGVKVDSNK